MSEMKNLLGDMDFEEILAKRELVLNKVKGLNINQFNELTCDDVELFYDYWLEIGGKYIANKRVYSHYNGYLTTIEQIDEFTQYLLDRFVDWLESF